jgi:replicative DNA helicase
MHYLTKKFAGLTEEEKQQVMQEMAEAYSTTTAKEDQYGLVLMQEFTGAARTRAANFGKMIGLSSGYPSLDKLTKGLVGGELIVLAGKTSYGKTTLAMNVANRVALVGVPVLFVTMEMTHAELTSRYMFINGGETEDYDQVSALTVYQQKDELDWKSIDGLIGRAVQSMGVGLVVIDHLHYFTRELENMAEDLGRITKELKKNAIRHDVPVVLISHVRKTFNDKEASIDDLRGSSYIAQDADIVLMVGRDPDDEHRLMVKIEKNRNRGYDYKNNVCELHFDQTRITELYSKPYIDPWSKR